MASFITTTYAYDSLGRLETTTLPDSVQLWNEYTGANLTRTYYKDASGNGIILDTCNGNLTMTHKVTATKSWDARNNLTEFAHDNLKAE